MTDAISADLAALTERLRRSTVAVRERGGGGSGIVWSADGAIVTNAHVARSATTEVELADGRVLRATLERRDERRDLALLRVAATGLEPAEVRDADEVRIGELVVAVGHPLGVPNAVATGIVRAKPDDLVRADVRLAPGNSGGPLADVHGRVVGVNAMVAYGAIALAVPSGVVQRFLGAVPAARLGVGLAPALVGGRRAHVVLAVEPGSAAAASGVLVGDVLFGDAARFGTAAELTMLRGGVPRTLTVRPAEGAAAA